MNRAHVLNCIQHHLQVARRHSSGTKPPSELRPLGELIPPIAEELRAGHSTQGLPVQVVPLPLVAAFIDGDITPEEEQLVCRAVLVDNSVLAELVASILALDEAALPAASLPPLSNALSERLQSLIPAPSQPKHDVANTQSPLQHTAPKLVPPTWIRPALWSLAMAASLALLVWWFNSQTSTLRAPIPVVDLPQQPQPPSIGVLPDIPTDVLPRNEELAAQPPIVEPEQQAPVLPLESPSASEAAASLAMTPSDPGQSMLAVVADQPAIENIQWRKITGLLAQRSSQSDYADDQGWRGVKAGAPMWNSKQKEATELLTLPLSRAEAELVGGGRLVMAADTKLAFASAGTQSASRIAIAHGWLALVDWPQGSAIEFNHDQGNATARWSTPKASLVVTVTDVGLQVQVLGGEVTINDRHFRNASVNINGANISELKDRNSRLPAWVSRSVENVPLSKAVLAQLAESDNILESLERLLDASALRNEADQGHLLLSSWRASLGDTNLLKIAENRSPAVRAQALNRLRGLPEWDTRYKRTWTTFSTLVENDDQLLFLRQAFELTRRGGKLNSTQVMRLVNFLESAQLAVRSLSDFILRSHFGGGPPFDANLSPPANTRNVGLWKRYINASRR